MLLIRMNAAETSASSAIADWTPLTVVPRSLTTAEIDTFIIDVSITSTNIAMANKMASRRLPAASSGILVLAAASIRCPPITRVGWDTIRLRLRRRPATQRLGRYPALPRNRSSAA